MNLEEFKSGSDFEKIHTHLFSQCNTTSLSKLRTAFDMYKKQQEIFKAQRFLKRANRWFEKVVLYPWQEEIRNVLVSAVHPRKIIWLYDAGGNVGKTLFCSKFSDLYSKEAFYGTNCKSERDLFHAIVQAKIQDLRIVLLDFARTEGNNVNYAVLEKIKNGRWISEKYGGEIRKDMQPHVVVCANFPPKFRDTLSADRWLIGHIQSDTKEVVWSEVKMSSKNHWEMVETPHLMEKYFVEVVASKSSDDDSDSDMDVRDMITPRSIRRAGSTVSSHDESMRSFSSGYGSQNDGSQNEVVQAPLTMVPATETESELNSTGVTSGGASIIASQMAITTITGNDDSKEPDLFDEPGSATTTEKVDSPVTEDNISHKSDTEVTDNNNAVGCSAKNTTPEKENTDVTEKNNSVPSSCENETVENVQSDVTGKSSIADGLEETSLTEIEVANVTSKSEVVTPPAFDSDTMFNETSEDDSSFRDLTAAVVNTFLQHKSDDTGSEKLSGDEDAVKEVDSVAKNLSELHAITTTLSQVKDTPNEDLPIAQHDTVSECDEADDADDFASMPPDRNTVVNLIPSSKKTPNRRQRKKKNPNVTKREEKSSANVTKTEDTYPFTPAEVQNRIDS